MNVPHATLSFLKPALKRVGWVLAAFGAVYALSAYVADQVAAGRRSAEAELAEAQNRYFASGRARQALQTYRARFEELRARGVVVEEAPRLAWLEAVQQSAEHTRLRSVSFDMAQTAPFVPEYPPVAANVAATPMTLKLELVHEGELVDFLARLQTSAPGQMWTRRCEIKRGDKVLSFSPNNDNLQARCEVVWLTLHTGPVPEPEGEGE
jgi:hypothetical protein